MNVSTSYSYPAATSSFSFVGRNYAYYYHNRGTGDRAFVSLQIKRTTLARFTKFHWPKTQVPRLIGTLFASRGSGWYRLESMDEFGEAGIRKFMRMLHMFFHPPFKAQPTEPRARSYGVVVNSRFNRFQVVDTSGPAVIPVSHKEKTVMVKKIEPHPFKEWFGGKRFPDAHCSSCGRGRNDAVHIKVNAQGRQLYDIPAPKVVTPVATEKLKALAAKFGKVLA